MPPTRDDIVSLAQTLFGEARYREALAIIDEYGREPHEREVQRVQLAILTLTDGKLSRLPYFVKCAKIDHRDVLSGQRLGALSAQEEAQWQATADHLLKIWNTK